MTQSRELAEKAQYPFTWAAPSLAAPYPLAKPAKNFLAREIPYKCPDDEFLAKVNSNKRKVTTIFKKGKARAQYSTRNYTEWYKIKQLYVKDIHKIRHNKISIFAGEVFRLIDINESPKYRVLTEEKTNCIISKGLLNPTSLYDYLVKHDYSFTYHEGIGRQFFLKYFLQESDMRFDNFYISKINSRSQYLYAIDHEFCFAPYTFQFYGQKDGVKPTLSLRDYNNLPFVRDYIVHNYDFGNLPRYSAFLETHPLFNNEKHFTALKILLSRSLIMAMQKWHIENPIDSLEICAQLKIRFQMLAMVLNGSTPFIRYLRNYKYEAFKAILFEWHTFQKDNRHYEPIPLISFIPKFSKLLKNLGLHPLTKTECSALTKVVFKLQEEDEDVLRQIGVFYSKQGMRAYAKLTLPPVTKPTFPKLKFFKEKENKAEPSYGLLKPRTRSF
jgi:hypothetical protein